MDQNEVIERFKAAQERLVLQYNELGLSTLSNMVAGGAIDVAPSFQRRDRWDRKKQSLLIESFLLNLPVPPVYLAEEEGGTFAVIDGRQRLTAIHSYMSGQLTLTDLETFPELDGTSFADLPGELQRNLAMRPLRSATLMRQTDPESKYLVFHRLNSAGEILNAQEIRNVIYRGPLNDLLFELSGHPFLKAQLKIDSEGAAAYRKMQDIEFVLRFMTLRDSWQRFSGDLAISMDSYMKTHQRPTATRLGALRSSFLRSLEACEVLWGYWAFKRPEKAGWRDQALAGLYDAQMVAIHELSDPVLRSVLEQPEKAVVAVRRLFGERAFEDAVRVGTNTPGRIRTRVDAMVRALSEIASA